MVFTANNKTGKLSKLKCKLPLIKQSQIIYQINCDDCQDFYNGMTTTLTTPQVDLPNYTSVFMMALLPSHSLHLHSFMFSYVLLN